MPRLVCCALIMCVGSLVGGEAASARPLLHPLFSDHAVLQRDRPLPVWGWDAPGMMVVVTLGQVKADAVAGADGRWQVQLPAQAAGGPMELVVVGSHREARSDILMGDVWLCSGQSNMGFSLKDSTGGPEAAAAAKDSELRLHMVTQKTSAVPLDVPAGGTWQTCSPESAAAFSAVGYYFGRDLRTHTKVPIGLIRSCWAGTLAEAWTSREALESLGEFTKDFPAPDGSSPNDVKRFGDRGQNRPTVLYNSMIHPLQPFALRGVIWYQGESNGYASLAPMYARQLPALIANWRAGFVTPDLPFGIVQLSSFGDPAKGPTDGGWAAIRDVQTATAHDVPGCGLAVTIDIGAKDYHPKNKLDVGLRLSLWARATVYGEKDLEWSGPWFRSMKVVEGTARVSYDHLGGGLKTKDGGSVKGFAIAGADKRWRFADATIDGNEIVLRSAEVPLPVAVRYAWCMNPVCNLTNSTGLPAVPFRTDDWK
ncbi:MAG: sialate O-acetylesterase [Planctomycetota bacterium]